MYLQNHTSTYFRVPHKYFLNAPGVEFSKYPDVGRVIEFRMHNVPLACCCFFCWVGFVFSHSHLFHFVIMAKELWNSLILLQELKCHVEPTHIATSHTIAVSFLSYLIANCIDTLCGLTTIWILLE